MRTLLPLLLLSVSLHAQTPYLVKDINTTYAQTTASSSPGSFTAYRGRIFFVATLSKSGKELWSTNGTSAGTSIVADLLSGEASSNPAALTVVNDTLLFSARDVDHGIELWASDGTAAGTRLLLDISPGPNSAQPAVGLVRGNRLYFSADDGTAGRELWISDGTAAGTHLLKDIEPGTGSSSPREFVVFHDTLYFLTNRGLWKTDGTEAGTVSVATVPARALTVAGPRMFFQGYTAATNWEPWTSDGTEAGTSMLAELAPGNKAAFPSNALQEFTVAGSRVFFFATDDVHGRELWVSDGTAAGTRMIRDFTPGAKGTWDNRYAALAAFGDRAFFGGYDEEHGDELWVTDGTDAGTGIFLDVQPGPNSSYGTPVSVAGGQLLFAAGVNNLPANLWATDGTASGTRKVRDAGGSDFFYAGAPVRIDGKLYFAGATALAGTEPWVTDGTDAGTHMIANLGADRAPSAFPRMFAATDGLLFFHATEGTLAASNSAEASLWRSDGTEAGTFKLLETGQHPTELTPLGPYVLFPETTNSRTLMISDGTPAGTKRADDFTSRFGNAEPGKFTAFGDTLFVKAGETLWKTTAALHAPAVDLGARNPEEVIEVAGRYMFYAQAPGSSGRGLWITDGTAAGTFSVVPQLTDSSYGLSRLVNAAGTVFFVKSTYDDPKTKLWKSDGSIDGTTVVTEVPFDSGVEMKAAGRRLFIATNDALWTSDGTAAGTIELAKASFPSFYYGNPLIALQNRILFLQEDRNIGVTGLWTSDGTVAGTKVLVQGSAGTPAVIDGLAYFAGTDAAHGTEIWATDGTAEGTKLLVDLNPGPASSDPAGFTKVGDALYFSAYTESTGQELWALPLTEPRLSLADSRAGESAPFVRFQVSLAGTAAQAVTVDYSTSDGTARAGQDYEAASGRLTFGPGERAKTIDVRILGDSAPEDNERFSLTLANAGGARLLQSEGTGIIDDDDQVADLGVAATFGDGSTALTQVALVSNQGPRSATNVKVHFTSVPDDGQDCTSCTIPQVAPGAALPAYAPLPYVFKQLYRSAFVTAHENDPNPSNNAASWTITDTKDMAMNAAFLTPGASATVTVKTDQYLPMPVPVSTDPSVLSIASGVTKNENGTATFTVKALQVGLALISVADHRHALNVIVVPEGTAPRWPDALQFGVESSSTRVDRPVTITVTPAAAAPLTGATATGTIVVTAAGQELARRSLTGPEAVQIPVYFRSTGVVSYQIAYGGDVNFFPQTLNGTEYVTQGQVSVTGHLERVPQMAHDYAVKVRVAGAPGAAPTGSVRIFDGAVLRGAVALTPSPDGASTAETTIANLPSSPRLTLQYDGDALYQSASQEIRLAESRRRTARH